MLIYYLFIRFVVRRVELRLYPRCGGPLNDRVAEGEINQPPQKAGVNKDYEI